MSTDRASELRVPKSRVRAASALRTLGHALVAHDASEADLDRLTALAAEFASRLLAGSSRRRRLSAMRVEGFTRKSLDGEVMEHFPDCLVSGKANPMGMAIDVCREGDDAVARVRLGAAFEGAPGRAHGGVVAAIFDDTMGYVLSLLSEPAFTARLSVSYLAPTPMGEELDFRARLRARDGRKLFIEGEARHEATVIAEAEGLFITIPLEGFGE